MSGPDPAGRARLLAAAHDLRSPTAAPRGRSPRRRWPRPAWAATFLVVDLLVGSLLWHVLRSHEDSPVAAVTRVASLAGQGDWSGVYQHLCAADRRQFSAAEVASGGTATLQVLHGLAGVRVTGARAVGVHLVGPVSLPAEQVSGQLVARLGPPFDFHVTTVRDLTGWRLCLSVGGYGSSALGVDVPLGS